MLDLQKLRLKTRAHTDRRHVALTARIALPSLLALPLGAIATAAPPAAGAAPRPGVSAKLARQRAGARRGTQSFRSAPGLRPPIVWTSGSDPDPEAGDIFADAQQSTQAGPLILDPSGQLIYFQPLRHGAALNVEVQSYQGQTVLTYWQGKVIMPGFGVGHDVILDHHYQPVATVHAGDGYHADLHEFKITPEGTALITAYARVRANLRSVGGPRHGTLLDSIVQKIDIKTGRLLWEWHAFGHVPLRYSYAKPGEGPYDFFHVNSIQQLPNGNLLISARHTWAVYEIDAKTGRVVWELGGKRSSFRMGRGTHFEWQHDAQLDGDTLTLFDDGAGLDKSERRSRALRIRLKYKPRRATLVRAYTSRPSVLATSQGNMQTMPDGNTFVGWGSASYLSEFPQRGRRQLFSLHFRYPIQSYRGYRFPWWGQPTWPPSIALATPAQGTSVFASWNGATEVAAWRVLAGPGPEALSPVGQFPKTLFETRMWVSDAEPYFAVQALGPGGQVLGTSTAAAR